MQGRTPRAARAGRVPALSPTGAGRCFATAPRALSHLVLVLPKQGTQVQWVRASTPCGAHALLAPTPSQAAPGLTRQELHDDVSPGAAVAEQVTGRKAEVIYSNPASTMGAKAVEPASPRLVSASVKAVLACLRVHHGQPCRKSGCFIKSHSQRQLSVRELLENPVPASASCALCCAASATSASCRRRASSAS